MIQKQKILLINFYANGDCLYATTIAQQIKNDFKNCHLTWAISTRSKDVLKNNPFIDEVLVVEYIPIDDTAQFKLLEQKINYSDYNYVFITHPSYLNNTALYDGCIRSNVFNAYPNPITVPINPVLQLTDEELKKCSDFAQQNNLNDYKNVILFEFAPLSGQLNITKEMAISIAEEIVKDKNNAIILSSANKINHEHKAIIDGSVLTYRETAGLTHYCTLLLGCSSGITWISTSTAAKLLPMVQILNPNALWVNSISRDFERFNLPVEKVIELFDFDNKKIVDCVTMAINNFPEARKQFNQQVPLQFKTTTKIVYELFCRFKFAQILKHIQVNRKVYGDKWIFYKEVIKGIITAPFVLIQNRLRKMNR